MVTEKAVTNARLVAAILIGVSIVTMTTAYVVYLRSSSKREKTLHGALLASMPNVVDGLEKHFGGGDVPPAHTDN